MTRHPIGDLRTSGAGVNFPFMSTDSAPLANIRAAFEEDGYWILEEMLDSDELTECATEIERLHRVAADDAAGASGASFQVEPGADGAQGERPVLRKIEETRAVSPVFKRLAEHPKLLEAVRVILGDDLLLFRSTLMLKPAHHGSAHGFHQDSAYWPMDPPALVTVSIALTDADQENGCIQVIPRSHLWGKQEWGRIGRGASEQMTDREDVDTGAAIDVPLKAGSALLFHSLTVHGSRANQSSRHRNTALYAYFPPTVRYVPMAGRPREMVYPVISGMEGRTEMTLTASA